MDFMKLIIILLIFFIEMSEMYVILFLCENVVRMMVIYFFLIFNE